MERKEHTVPVISAVSADAETLAFLDTDGNPLQPSEPVGYKLLGEDGEVLKEGTIDEDENEISLSDLATRKFRVVVDDYVVTESDGFQDLDEEQQGEKSEEKTDDNDSDGDEAEDANEDRSDDDETDKDKEAGANEDSDENGSNTEESSDDENNSSSSESTDDESTPDSDNEATDSSASGDNSDNGDKDE